jgi:hypothetical protein
MQTGNYMDICQLSSKTSKLMRRNPERISPPALPMLKSESICNMSAYVVATQRLTQAVVGLVTAITVTHYLSPEEQGYFYAMLGLAALYMFFDMGLSTILVNLSATKFVGLHFGPRGKVIGAEREGFLSLTHSALYWYVLTALAFLLMASIATYFLAGLVHSGLIDWKIPWILLIFTTAANLIVTPFFSISEGSGRLIEVYTLRMIQALGGGVCTWFILVNGKALYAVAMPMLFSLVIGSSWLILRHLETIRDSLKHSRKIFPWRVLVWPLQVRTIPSFLIGYTLVTGLAPLMLWTQGPIIAGKIGLTITLINMISIISTSPYTAKVPIMVRASTCGDWTLFDATFARISKQSIFLFCVGNLSLALLISQSPEEVQNRVLPLPDFVILSLAMLFYHTSNLFANYCRLYLKEPFIWSATIGLLLVLTTLFTIPPQRNATSVAIIILSINALYFFPISIYTARLFKGKYQNYPS